MAAQSPTRRETTLTGSRPSPEREPEGAIAGYLFKVIREQIPRTQEELAEELGVDKSTLQGWESGRRPLSSTRAGNLVAMRRKLILLGAPPGLVDMLSTAMDADLLLGEILRAEPIRARLRGHPLAGWVLTRDTTHMIGWAVSGVLPGVVAAYSTIPAARRGPVSSSPLLEPARTVLSEGPDCLGCGRAGWIGRGSSASTSLVPRFVRPAMGCCELV